jgi:plasmid stabilization system protein ParE
MRSLFEQTGKLFMARGSKKKYTRKQKRKASHIERGYEKRGVGKKEAERRAWATVNKSDKGGREKGGGGRGKRRSRKSSRKGGRKGVRKRKRH